MYALGTMQWHTIQQHKYMEMSCIFHNLMLKKRGAKKERIKLAMYREISARFAAGYCISTKY